MADPASLKPPTLNGTMRLSHQVFLLGIAVRVWLTLSLNTSYLYPEENDSQRQLQSQSSTHLVPLVSILGSHAVLGAAGDIFGEWSSHDRVRSTLWPLLTNGLPSVILSLLFGKGTGLRLHVLQLHVHPGPVPSCLTLP